MLNKKNILRLFLVVSVYLVNAQDNQRRTLTTSPFIGVKVYSGLEVNLIASEVNKAVVYGSQSDDVILGMKNGVLQLKIALGSISDSLPTRVDLYHSKLLNEITATQQAKITSQVPLVQTSLNLKSSTAAVIDFEIYADRLDAVATNGGRIELEGTVSSFNLNVNTGGSCEAEQLQTTQVQTKLIGGGYAYVTVSDLINAEVIAGSVLRVYGDPVKKVYQKKLGGKLYFEK
ncbi:MAG: GIN domain-containing protein [Flavobacteriaceae bacterium]